MKTDKVQPANSKPKWIVRASRNEQTYFMMARSTAQDERLSWAARGMLTYLLSKPDDWRVSIKDLQQGCGHNKVYTLLNELIRYRYVARERVTDDKHRIESVDYYVYETPLSEKPGEEKPLTCFPYVEKPDTENRDSYILESIQNRESTYSLEPAVPEAPVPKEETMLQAEPKRKANPVYDWVASAIFKVTPESAEEDKDVHRWIGANAAKLINAEKIKLGVPKKVPLTDEQRAALALQLPGLLKFYNEAAPGYSPPMERGKFGKLVLQWYAAGKPYSVVPLPFRWVPVERDEWVSETEAI